MAFLGLRTRDAGLGGGSTADLLIKALTGDPEREMALARARSAIDTDAYQRRQIQASTEKLRAETLARQAETDARVGSVPAAAQLAYDNLPEPVPVAIPTPSPAPRPAAFSSGSDFSDGDYDPVAVDPVYGPATATGDWLPAGSPAPVAQPMPGDVIDTRPAVADIEKLMAAGAWTADPMGQYGKGAGEVGIVYGTGTPEEQRRNALLYANKVPGEGGGGETASAMRAQLMGDESYAAMSTIDRIYPSLMQTASQNDRTSDFDLVTGIAKMVDPEGVVRGEDVNMIVANQPGMELFRSYLETWQSDPNARLGPDIRRDLMALAFRRASSVRDLYNRRAADFGSIAKRSGLNPADVVPTFGEIQPWTPPDASTEPPPPPVPTDRIPLPPQPADYRGPWPDAALWERMTPEDQQDFLRGVEASRRTP